MPSCDGEQLPALLKRRLLSTLLEITFISKVESGERGVKPEKFFFAEVSSITLPVCRSFMSVSIVCLIFNARTL